MARRGRVVQPDDYDDPYPDVSDDEIKYWRQRRLAEDAARDCFAAFFTAFLPARPYVLGRHTIAMLDILDSVTKSVERGENRYVILNIPFRHGKSDVASRRYPAWHLLRNPDHEVALVSYNEMLATDLSYDARGCFTRAAALGGLALSQDMSARSRWRVFGLDGEPRKGVLYAIGIGGTITGRGAHVLIIDDCFKNRMEAESRAIREHIWDALANDLMTRLSPDGAHAVVIVMNRWHEDDICGRIIKRNNPKSDAYDSEFPSFEVVKFPAYDEANDSWLFEERIPVSWYKKQWATLGSYARAAMLQQEPRSRTGSFLKAQNTRFVPMAEFEELSKNVRFVRGWDQASTAAERTSSNPDFTVGTLAGFDHKTDTIFIRDVTRGRWEAGKKLDEMERCCLQDRVNGYTPTAIIEVVGGYVDVYNLLRMKMGGKANVRKFVPVRDKVARASVTEPHFEGGRVVAVKAPWNAQWLDEMCAFPSPGWHDDDADSLVTAVHGFILGTGRIEVTR